MLDNVIAIKGTSNLRDIGGYPTRYGRPVRRGKIYRAEATDKLCSYGAAKSEMGLSARQPTHRARSLVS